jgi:hypothetical protein
MVVVEPGTAVDRSPDCEELEGEVYSGQFCSAGFFAGPGARAEETARENSVDSVDSVDSV